MSTTVPPADKGREEREANNDAIPTLEPKGFLQIGGAIAQLTWQALKEIPHSATAYAPELVRQAGIMATGSIAVVLSVSFLSGAECGVQCEIVTRQFGAEAVVTSPIVLCTIRIISVLVFGYVIAAKVGCGLTAELGAMQVHDEVDAMESLGIRSTGYLVTSRLLAALITLPFVLLLSLATSVLGAYVVTVVMHGTVSPGTFVSTFFNFLQPADIPKAFATGMVMIVVVVSTSLYYGMTVRGGPVDVGIATAKSMAINVVAVTVVTTVSTLTLYGTGNQLPIA